MWQTDLILSAFWAAGLLALVAALGEWLHSRRCGRVGRLAFGPEAKPRSWVRIVPVARVLGIAGIAWCLVVLSGFDGSSRSRDRNVAATHHLMVLLDVSPSMQIKDAGQGMAQTRANRAGELIKSVMERTHGDRVRITMACFYREALLLVKESNDRELIWNFADDLPLHIAFRPGKTDLVKSLNQAGDFVKEFPRKSTTLLVITDGDMVPDAGLSTLPSAISKTIIAGVGDPGRGTFLDGHLSRQDSANLSQLARRLGGEYHNGNTKHVPSESLRQLMVADEGNKKLQIGARTLAIIILAVCSAVICLLPIVLELFGSAWKPVPRPTDANGKPTGLMKEAAL